MALTLSARGSSSANKSGHLKTFRTTKRTLWAQCGGGLPTLVAGYRERIIGNRHMRCSVLSGIYDETRRGDLAFIRGTYCVALLLQPMASTTDATKTSHWQFGTNFIVTNASRSGWSVNLSFTLMQHVIVGRRSQSCRGVQKSARVCQTL